VRFNLDFDFSDFIFDMKKEIKTNTITWILLVVLIIANMLFSENGFVYSYLIIVLFSAFKFLVVSYQFVEVKHAHVIWKGLCFLFAAVYVCGVLALY
jgi:uncharacterized membrane protein YobD (UPF0266 family)